MGSQKLTNKLLLSISSFVIREIKRVQMLFLCVWLKSSVGCIVVILSLICCNLHLINLIHKFFSVFFRSAFVYRGLRVVALLGYVCQYWERVGGKGKAHPLHFL